MLMDCFSSIPPRSNLSVATPDFKALSKQTHFSIKELKLIFARFESCCDEKTGMLSENDFLQMPEIAFSPLVPLVYDLEVNRRRKEQDLATSKYVGFDMFVLILNEFSCKAGEFEKILYLFNLLKSKESESVNEDQFKRFIGTIYQGTAPPEVFEEYKDVAWRNASVKGELEKGRFTELLSSFDLNALMTLNF